MRISSRLICLSCVVLATCVMVLFCHAYRLRRQRPCEQFFQQPPVSYVVKQARSKFKSQNSTQQRSENATLNAVRAQFRAGSPTYSGGLNSTMHRLASIYIRTVRRCIDVIVSNLTVLSSTHANETSNGLLGLHASQCGAVAAKKDTFGRGCITRAASPCGCQTGKRSSPEVPFEVRVRRLGAKRYDHMLVDYANIMALFQAMMEAPPMLIKQDLGGIKQARRALALLVSDANRASEEVNTDGRMFSVACMFDGEELIPEHDAVASISNDAIDIAAEVAAAGYNHTTVHQFVRQQGNVDDILAQAASGYGATNNARAWLMKQLRALCMTVLAHVAAYNQPSVLPAPTATKKHTWSNGTVTTIQRADAPVSAALFAYECVSNIQAIIKSTLYAVEMPTELIDSVLDQFTTLTKRSSVTHAAFSDDGTPETSEGADAAVVASSSSDPPGETSSDSVSLSTLSSSIVAWPSMPKDGAMAFEFTMLAGSSQLPTKIYHAKLPWNIPLCGLKVVCSDTAFTAEAKPLPDVVMASPQQQQAAASPQQQQQQTLPDVDDTSIQNQRYGAFCEVRVTRIKKAAGCDELEGWETPVAVHFCRDVSQVSLEDGEPADGTNVVLTNILNTEAPYFTDTCAAIDRFLPLNCRYPRATKAMKESIQSYRDSLFIIDDPIKDASGNPGFMTNYAYDPVFVYNLSMYVKQLVVRLDNFGASSVRTLWVGADGKAPSSTAQWRNRSVDDIYRLVRLHRGLKNLCKFFYLVAVDSPYTSQYMSEDNRSGTSISTTLQPRFDTYYQVPLGGSKFKRSLIYRNLSSLTLTFRRKDRGLKPVTVGAASLPNMDKRSQDTLGMISPFADNDETKDTVNSYFAI